MEQWSDGVYLLGRYGEWKTGCWLLTSGTSGAIVEIPPYNVGQWPPSVAARLAAEQLGVTIEYLLCSHTHGGHLSPQTLRDFSDAFPNAVLHVHDSFEPYLAGGISTRYFQGVVKLGLGGEALFLVHAPKHSLTDTIIVFRGVAFTGDWELNTIRSMSDGREGENVPLDIKLQSINRLRKFPDDQGYVIHRIFSTHANDRREKVDFAAVIEDTKQDRQFW